MNNTWKMEEFTAQEIHKKQIESKIVVPKYQREIVWKENQKKELIDSIKKGIPFGSILLYEDERLKNYRLIDGLQRCKTIYEFISNPANYFDENDIDDEAINQLKQLINEEIPQEDIREKIVEIIIKWIKRQHDTMQDIIRMQYHDCAEMITRELPALDGKERQVVEIIKPVFNRYIEICHVMSQAKIPAIVIMGDEDILPTVFERINSKGSKLTKWQIYAATWAEEKIRIMRELKQIVSYNKKRYEAMVIEDEILLQDFDPIEIERNAQLNIFELIYGFGKLISERFPHLFTTSKKVTEVNSVGFNLINACLAFKNSDIKNLNKNLREVIGTDEQINQFLLAIIECIEIVDNVLAITTKFKSNLRADTAPLHTEMQICSIIASVFINKYVTLKSDNKDVIIERNIHVDRPNENWKNYKERFLKNALIAYLVDILQVNWTGSGDKKLNYIILNPNYYTRKIEKEEFKTILNLWYENIRNERNEYQRIPNPKEADKVILNIIYSNEFNAVDQIDDSKYDIEHLATKASMKSQLERFNGDLRLPISSIGNLCLLPEEYNRAKGERTIYEYEDPNIEIEEIEKKYSFTTKEDMEWIVDRNISRENLKEEYIKFINKRYEKIREKLIEILYKHE